jgi:hypothetical protein
MLNFKKYQTSRSSLKKTTRSLPLITILSFSFYQSVYAETKKENQTLKSNQVTAQNKSTSETKIEEKPDPTEDVAGGVGKKGYNAPKYAVLPTGKTLPKGIFKIDIPVAYSFGKQGFDSNGKRVDNGISYSRWITGVQIQYGLSSTVSVGVGIPIVGVYQVGMNGTTVAANSELYARYYEHVVHDLASKLSLQSGTMCGGNSTTADCTNFINNGGSFANLFSLPLTLPTGETITFNSGSSLKNQIHNLLLTASQPTNGATGIGDIQLGILWSVVSEESPIMHVPLYISIGGGLRIPTGKFNIITAMKSTGGDGTLITGGGTYDAILRWNLDYVIMPGVILSWQHQSEYSITKADLNRSSMLDDTSFNTANPMASGGDGQGNTLLFWRKGLHHIGFLQTAWGLGNVTNSLKWLGLYTQAKYNIAAKAYLNGQPIYTFGDQFYLGENSMHPDHGYEQYYSAAAGSKMSGLPYQIPVELSAEFEFPFAGYNRMVSPMNFKGTFSFYF